MVLNQCGSSDISRSKAAKLALSANSTRPGPAARSMRTVSLGSKVVSWRTEVRWKNHASAPQITK